MYASPFPERSSSNTFYGRRFGKGLNYTNYSGWSVLAVACFPNEVWFLPENDIASFIQLRAVRVLFLTYIVSEFFPNNTFFFNLEVWYLASQCSKEKYYCNNRILIKVKEKFRTMLKLLQGFL